MLSKYKLTHKFQERDERDYLHKSIQHPKNNALLITTIKKKNTTDVMVVKASVVSNFLLKKLPPILDQGQLGTCVTNAFSYAVSNQTNNCMNLSRLQLYAICRSLDNTPLSFDDGTTIRTACQAIRNYGVCKESVYPYIEMNVSNLPPLVAFNSSKKFKKFTYLFINQDLISIKNALQRYNSPIIFGIMVYQSFMQAKDGKILMPDIENEKLLGGHCVTLVGYNDATKMFTCANSWSKTWGINGYFMLPYAYVLDPNLSSDFCVTTYEFN
jgi:C1A family cysteine protease